MGRAPCCTKVGLRRGPWSIKEDTTLTNYIQEHGEGQWRSLPKNAGLLRCGKSCRLRWMNYLRPGIKRGNISQDEEDLIVRLHALLGNRWSLIAGRLPGRTDNEIKNYWNTHLIKKLKNAGLNPKPNKDLPKIPKPRKSTGAGKRKKKQKQVNEAIAAEKSSGELEVSRKVEEHVNSTDDDPPKTKVYLPKPIRVSSVFSRTSSYDSLASGTSSSEGGGGAAKKAAAAAMEVAAYVPVAWPPLFELGDASFGVVGGGEEDFLGVGRILPALQDQSDSMSGDVNMWERVYDEYFQLL